MCDRETVYSLPNRTWPSSIDTSSLDLISDFFVPALASSVRYDRGVGFFSSAWLRVAAQGMVKFAANGGRARWVTSPILDSDDWDALQTGDAARTDSMLFEILTGNISDLAESLERETLTALAWMVADEILTFKLALPRNKLERGDFHDKFGIFTDAEGNQVSFNGSYNDSIQGLRNYESIKVFCSWEPHFGPLVQFDAQRFENLWNNLDPNVRVFDLPEAAREQILRLRMRERPYPTPEWVRLQVIREVASSGSVNPRIPDETVLRDYQEDAVRAWFDAECRGLYEMATGTGKTITALAAATRLIEQKSRLALVISCPFKHLVEQWADEAQRFGFRPIKVAESRVKWEGEVFRAIQNLHRRRSDVVCIITTNASLQKGVLPKILEDVWSEALLIIDEAHYAGAPRMLSALPEKAPWRLGLSATPIRHYDEDGTEVIFSYFQGVVYQMGLKEAIGEYLTPYYYYPLPVEMTEEEFQQFCVLTRQIQRLTGNPDAPMSEAAKRIAIKRARVMNNSVSKINWLNENIPQYADLQHTLFYVGDQIFSDVKRLLGVEKRVRIHEFTQRQDNRQRREILERFASGDLQALVAMKCLDEGVDVPPTRTAYFLASSGNPREFVQRRGRVLRKAEGKTHATLYDLISIPPVEFIALGEESPDYGAVRAAIRREYRRVKEFASLAENHYQALNEMFEIADRLDLLDA